MILIKINLYILFVFKLWRKFNYLRRKSNGNFQKIRATMTSVFLLTQSICHRVYYDQNLFIRWLSGTCLKSNQLERFSPFIAWEITHAYKDILLRWDLIRERIHRSWSIVPRPGRSGIRIRVLSRSPRILRGRERWVYTYIYSFVPRRRM